MVTLAHSEDPDEMLRDGTLHLGLHCLPRQNRYYDIEMQCIWKL